MRENKRNAFLIAGILSFALVFTPFQDALCGQETPDSSRLNGAYFKKLGADFKNVLLSPGHWDKNDILTFAVFLGTSGMLYALDQNLYDRVQQGKNSGTVDASKVISKFGDGGYLASFMAALYVSGEAFDSAGLRKTALLSMESFLTTSAVVMTMKAVFGRARPYSGKPSNIFRPFSFSTRYTSLPSGDAAGAFAVAATIADRSDVFIVDALAYGLAGLVAFYRVHDRKHWPSDVFIGSALGYFIGKKVSAMNRNNASSQVHLGFHLSSESRGITLTFVF
jgi:hypothetical protein